MQTITTLNDPSLITGRYLIGGSWVEAVGGASIAVENPANGENLGCVPDCGRAETDMAIAAAARAFGPWSGKAAGERATLLDRGTIWSSNPRTTSLC
jgi:succinate-semialdehyde dehydrogenase/glutarate-semialdehyde dehydrogenase